MRSKVAYCFGGCKGLISLIRGSGKELHRMDQGAGDLGQRMKRLLARFQTTRLIIGSDIPD